MIARAESPPPVPPSSHHIHNYLRLVAALGASCEPLPPRITISPEEAATTAARLGLPSAREDSPLLGLNPGAEYGPAKRWPAKKYAQLALKVSRGVTGGNPRGSTPIWLVGSAKDALVGAEIERLSDGAARNHCGRTSLEQVIDLIAGARAVVSNDSGLMHVAAALDRPLVAIYGSSSPTYTPPLSPHARMVSLNLECSPCFERECPLGHLNCLNEMQPELVLAALGNDV